VQNGIFHPRFTIHSWNSDGTVNEPWMYPEMLPFVRQAIEFRYRLIPYLYTLFFEAARTGQPIIRPMVYHYSSDPPCQTQSFDFMLGPNLLVASVLEDGARERSVYLPNAEEWWNFHTGEWHDGGQIIKAEAPLERIPLFVPAGGIIPMGKMMRYVGEQADDVRQAYVFPHPRQGRGLFTLVEDDGVSLKYQQGEYTEVPMEVVADTHSISLQVNPPRGEYPLPYSEIDFILPSGETRPVQVEGGGEIWTDAQERLHVTVPVPHSLAGNRE
jgi:alpha-glucosidase